MLSMSISYDSLPTTKPVGFTLPAGKYMATITKAEINFSPANPAPKGYLAVTYDITDGDKGKGKFWDNIFDSDKQLLRYKLMRFINALQLPLEGEFELKDLCKIIKGKKLVMILKIDEKNAKGPKNELDMFDSEIFYPIAEWASLQFGVVVDPNAMPPVPTTVVAPVTAADALDAILDAPTPTEY